MNRHFIFKNYWWIAVAGALVGIGLVELFATGPRASLVGSIVAAALGFSYFSQQQKLAEMNLFKELFTEFNSRYKELNKDLDRLMNSGMCDDEVSRQTVIDYFILCGEEYLFFTEGYIHRDAWQSWCAGMISYFDREPFKSIWVEQELTGSYYGLSLDTIRRNADLPRAR